jgi:type II secretory ATPase GspE/PulE/Tfp pilus assembly ATPase PilB-like protein
MTPGCVSIHPSVLRERVAVTRDGEKQLDGSGFEGRPTVSFPDFVDWLLERTDIQGLAELRNVSPGDLFSVAEEAGVSVDNLTQWISRFCEIPFVSRVQREDVEFRTLSRPFCEANLILPIRSAGSRQTVILSNPFDWELLEDLERTLARGRTLALLLASPGTIRTLLAAGPSSAEMDNAGEEEVGAELMAVPEPSPGPERGPRTYDPAKDPGHKHPLAELAMELLSRVLAEDGTHLLVEAKGEGAAAKAHVAGRTYELQEMDLKSGRMLVARFKALSGMDLAKKRTPQNGALQLVLRDRVIKLRLSTSPTSAFENLSVRILDPTREAVPLHELGLSSDQIRALHAMAGRESGLILFVGPLGSGKTTTIYSLLSAVADPGRTVFTVEDPIEHKIPHAIQQEVGPDAGARSLLQHAVQANPDVLYLNEVRDLMSAQACVEFTKSGHLALTSMNSSNASTAIFRLERLGVSRGSVADVLAGVVAQRLLKKLCPDCRKIRPISPEEVRRLLPYARDLPEKVADPVGCSSCRGTGYRGREAVFEVIAVDSRMAKLISEGRPIAEIRDFAQVRGDLLVGDHAMDKVRDLTFSVEDVYRGVLLEEVALVFEPGEGEDGQGPPVDGEVASKAEGSAEAETEPILTAQATILVVEDEEGTRFLLDQLLSKAGYRVIRASDGGEALLKLGAEAIDLILSDIYMPNLDGLKLLEILNQHEMDIPVVLLTGEPSPGVEARGREMGVAAYLRKPVQRDVLLESIEEILSGD